MPSQTLTSTAHGVTIEQRSRAAQLRRRAERKRNVERSTSSSLWLRSLSAWGMVFTLNACAAGTDATADRALTGRSIVLEPTVMIGEIEGDTDYLFGDIRSVALDDDGHIYVGDRIGATVRVYSPTGVFIRRIAREGQGPGEVDGWPADITFDSDGRLYVRDASRVTVFARSSSGGLADSVAEVWRVPGYGNLSYARSRVAADGTYFYPDGLFRINDRPRFFYLPFRAGDVSADTVEVPFREGMGGQRSAFYRTSASGGRMVDGLSRVPFAAVPTWDVTPSGNIISTDGRTSELLETSPGGDTVRVLMLGGTSPRPVASGERSDSLRALQARIDSLPVPLDQVMNLGDGIADRHLPDAVPAIMAIHVATDGLVWVERWPPEGARDARFYDVFDNGGSHLAAVTLRAPLAPEPPVFFSRRGVVGVVRDEATGVDRVVVFSLDGLPGNGDAVESN
jgi:hypothetical protein